MRWVRAFELAGEGATLQVGLLMVAGGPLAHPRLRRRPGLRADFLTLTQQECYLGIFLHRRSLRFWREARHAAATACKAFAHAASVQPPAYCLDMYRAAFDCGMWAGEYAFIESEHLTELFPGCKALQHNALGLSSKAIRQLPII